MNEYVLQTVNVSKRYQKKDVLKNVNMKVKKGDIYGFIGLNGAGKSTLIRLVAGLTFPTTGKIELFGQHNEKELIDARKRMGTLIENPALFPHMTANDNLEVIRIQRGIPGKGCIKEALEKVGLEDTGKKKVKKFSLGMKQRLGIAVALLNEPELLILDEPINGLDPMGVVEIRELLKQINQEYGVTILVSSHILSEVHQLATEFGIIHKGELVEQISEKQLDKKCRAHLLIKVDHTSKAVTVLEEALHTSDFKVLPDESIKLYSHLDDSQTITETFVENGLKIEQVTPKRDTLESYFTRVIREERPL